MRYKVKLKQLVMKETTMFIEPAEGSNIFDVVSRLEEDGFLTKNLFWNKGIVQETWISKVESIDDNDSDAN